MAEQSPPAYEESDTRDTTSAPPSQDQFNSGYTPVQYNLAGQDPERFYGDLIHASNHPSEILCRMSDALFFHLNQHCNQFRGTMLIEPAKLTWLNIAIGYDPQVITAAVKYMSALYDVASVPYTFNDARQPVLDRRGYLHLCVSDIRADPADSRQQWNKILNTLKLHDPMTNLPFPTPIPRSAFPLLPHMPMKQAYDDWQAKTSQLVSREITPAQQTGTPINNSNAVSINNPPTDAETQVWAAFRAKQEEQRTQTMRMIIDSMAPYPDPTKPWRR